MKLECFNFKKMKFMNKTFEFIEYEKIKNNKDYILFDLRSYREYNINHIKDSIHLPLMEDYRSFKLEKMFNKKNYFRTCLRTIYYMFPEFYRILNTIRKYNKKHIIVLGCRHANIRSRTLAMIVNLLGFKVKVLKDGINPILIKSNYKEVI